MQYILHNDIEKESRPSYVQECKPLACIQHGVYHLKKLSLQTNTERLLKDIEPDNSRAKEKSEIRRRTTPKMMLQTIGASSWRPAKAYSTQRKRPQPARNCPDSKKRSPIARSKILIQDEAMQLDFATGLPHTMGQRMTTTPSSISPPMITLGKARKGGMTLKREKQNSHEGKPQLNNVAESSLLHTTFAFHSSMCAR